MNNDVCQIGEGFRCVARILAVIAMLLLSACVLERNGMRGPEPSELGPGPDSGDEPPTNTAQQRCGNGVKEAAEDCDGVDFGAGACTSFGYDGGLLSCDSDCGIDTGGCVKLPEQLEGQWRFRKRITFPAGGAPSDLNVFPVLVSISHSEFFEHTRADGRDVMFVDNHGKPLPYERELYDVATNRFLAWVLLPVIYANQETSIEVYYGSPDVGETETPSLVWGYGFSAVWHLSEPAVDELETTLHIDSTGKGHFGTQQGNKSVVGVIGQAQEFDGVDDHIVVANSHTIALGQTDCTISAWLKTATNYGSGIFIKSGETKHAYADKLFGLNFGQSGRLGVDHGGVGSFGGNSSISDDFWHHVAWVQEHDDTTKTAVWRLYVDGKQLAAKPHVPTKLDDGNHTVRLGGRSLSSVFAQFFQGHLDEVRVSNFARGSAWLSASYANQKNPASFALVGAEEQISVFPEP